MGNDSRFESLELLDTPRNRQGLTGTEETALRCNDVTNLRFLIGDW